MKFRNDIGYSLDDVLLIPKYNPISSRLDTDVSTRLTRTIPLNIPLMATNMATVTELDMMKAMSDIGGVGALHRFMEVDEQVNTVKQAVSYGVNPIVASIGVGDYEFNRASKLIEAGAQVILLDIAHGHSQSMVEQLNRLKQNFPDTQYIVGNIVTQEAATTFLDNGADALRVGIGGGANCITRTVTGYGVPNLTAIVDVAEIRDFFLKETGTYIPIIIDGGIKNSGHIVKALAFGADVACIGNLFAGTTESPGEVIDGFKKHYGMASKSAQDYHRGGMKPGTAAEGITTSVPFKGSVIPIANELVGGIRSGLTYGGASTIDELRNNSEVMIISPGARQESKL